MFTGMLFHIFVFNVSHVFRVKFPPSSSYHTTLYEHVLTDIYALRSCALYPSHSETFCFFIPDVHNSNASTIPTFWQLCSIHSFYIPISFPFAVGSALKLNFNTIYFNISHSIGSPCALQITDNFQLEFTGKWEIYVLVVAVNYK